MTHAALAYILPVHTMIKAEFKLLWSTNVTVRWLKWNSQFVCSLECKCCLLICLCQCINRHKGYFHLNEPFVVCISLCSMKSRRRMKTCAKCMLRKVMQPNYCCSQLRHQFKQHLNIVVLLVSSRVYSVSAHSCRRPMSSRGWFEDCALCFYHQSAKIKRQFLSYICHYSMSGNWATKWLLANMFMCENTGMYCPQWQKDTLHQHVEVFWEKGLAKQERDRVFNLCF